MTVPEQTNRVWAEECLRVGQARRRLLLNVCVLPQARLQYVAPKESWMLGWTNLRDILGLFGPWHARGNLGH